MKHEALAADGDRNDLLVEVRNHDVDRLLSDLLLGLGSRSRLGWYPVALPHLAHTRKNLVTVSGHNVLSPKRD